MNLVVPYLFILEKGRSMKKRIPCKAIIFDMDGTIVDTNAMWEGATEKLLVSKGVNYLKVKKTVSELLDGGAGGLRSGCALLRQMFDLSDTPEQLAREKKAYAHEFYHNGIDFIKGFPEFYAQVAHIPTAIATNSDDHTLDLARKALKLDRFFGEHMYGISQVSYVGKPDPAIYLYAARKLNRQPSDCVAFEDSATGIRAAQAAGMFCIGINSHGNRDIVSLADIVVDSYDEVDFLDIL